MASRFGYKPKFLIYTTLNLKQRIKLGRIDTGY
jgi:hypothetical protein